MAAIGSRALGKFVDDKSGILKKMRKREANALLRYALSEGARIFIAEDLPTRFTAKVRQPPWSYYGGGDSPLYKSGRLRALILAGARVEVRVTSTRARIVVRMPSTWYTSSKARGGGGKTYGEIIRTVSAQELNKIVKNAERVLVEEFEKTEKSTIQRGKTAGQQRASLTVGQRSRMGVTERRSAA